MDCFVCNMTHVCCTVTENYLHVVESGNGGAGRLFSILVGEHHKKKKWQLFLLNLFFSFLACKPFTMLCAQDLLPFSIRDLTLLLKSIYGFLYSDARDHALAPTAGSVFLASNSAS